MVKNESSILNGLVNRESIEEFFKFLSEKLINDYGGVNTEQELRELQEKIQPITCVDRITFYFDPLGNQLLHDNVEPNVIYQFVKIEPWKALRKIEFHGNKRNYSDIMERAWIKDIGFVGETQCDEGISHFDKQLIDFGVLK